MVKKTHLAFRYLKKLQFFNTDEFIERTGKEEENDVHAAECRAGEGARQGDGRPPSRRN
jgi:hypothetical protein